MVMRPAARDAFMFGVYTGMHIQEVLALRWERSDTEGLSFRVDETKTGEPPELPISLPLVRVAPAAWSRHYRRGTRDVEFPAIQEPSLVASKLTALLG